MLAVINVRAILSKELLVSLLLVRDIS